MTQAKEAPERREVRSIARRYKRKGYSVTEPTKGGSMPGFLEGLSPDLIAEREDDRVVIEVKQTRALRGSNELRTVAERVSREPGWRFELVAVASVEALSPPPPEVIAHISSRARQVMNEGYADFAYVFAWSLIETLLSELARRNGLSADKSTSRQLARNLVTLGVISKKVFDAIEEARVKRNRLLHLVSEALPRPAEVENLLALGEELRGEFATAA
jgi:hypothetical protein